MTFINISNILTFGLLFHFLEAWNYANFDLHAFELQNGKKNINTSMLFFV